MPNEIQIFEKVGAGNMRAFLDENGEPLFVAADVARILGYGDASHMTRRLDDDEKGLRPVETPGGVQTMNVITEAGLYNAVLGSKVPGAKDFKRWVTHEVLPELRKRGRYDMREMDDKTAMAYGLLAAQREVNRLTERAERAEHKCDVLKLRNQELSDKAGMWDKCMDGERWCSFTEVARRFHQYDPRMTRKKLFELCQADGLIDRNKQATMKAIDRGYLMNYQPPAYFDQTTGELVKAKPYAKFTAKGEKWAFDRWVRVERAPFQMLTEEMPLASAI